MNGVGPVAVERMRREVDARALRVRDTAGFRIGPLVESTATDQATRRGRRRNQVDDHVVRDERLATPVLGDERESAVFALVPLARTRSCR